MSAISPPERPMRADARRNRQLILEAARELYADANRQVQVDDIADRAAVGVGTVYRHFPTKEALMGELVRERFASFAQHAREAVASDGEPFVVLADLLRRNAEHMARDAATRHAISGASDEVWAYASSEHDALLALAAELVDRGHRAGSLRADFTVEEIPMLMCGVSATMTNAAFDWRRHLELVLDGLRAR